MIEAIADAIRNKRCITFNYSPGIRYIEPHALGRSAAGDLLLRAYQTDGASASGEHEHWKLFRIDKCGGQESNGDTFLGPREGYKQNDKAMKGGIIAQL
jgi:hypothetical protein